MSIKTLTTKTLTTNLFAGAFVAASVALALNSASAFGPVANQDVLAPRTAVTSHEIDAKDIGAKKQKAPEGYHLQGFKGWDQGYPINFRGCSPASKAISGACLPAVTFKSAV